MQDYQGKLITVEGIEGVGKTTNVRFIQNYLTEKNIESIVTREPGGTLLAESLRQLLLNEHEEEISVKTEALILFAARAQHLHQVILPSLKDGVWVICDRFTDATYAYQGYGGSLSVDQIALLESFVQHDFRPDLTILLDSSVATAFQRVSARAQEKDRMEQKSANFFEKVRQGYLTLAEKYPDRIKCIDASQPVQDVQAAIVSILQSFVVLDYNDAQ